MAAPIYGQPAFTPGYAPEYAPGYAPGYAPEGSGWGHHRHDFDHDDDRDGDGDRAGRGRWHRMHTPGSLPPGFGQQYVPPPTYSPYQVPDGGWTTTTVPRSWANPVQYGYPVQYVPQPYYAPTYGYYTVPQAPWYARIAAALLG